MKIGEVDVAGAQRKQQQLDHLQPHRSPSVCPAPGVVLTLDSCTIIIFIRFSLGD